MGTVSSALPLTGIIRVDTGKKGANQVLYVFQVGEVDEKSPSLDFTLRPEYESSGIYLQDIKEIHAETVQALEKCVNLENADAEIVLDSEGKGGNIRNTRSVSNHTKGTRKTGYKNPIQPYIFPQYEYGANRMEYGSRSESQGFCKRKAIESSSDRR